MKVEEKYLDNIFTGHVGWTRLDEMAVLTRPRHKCLREGIPLGGEGGERTTHRLRGHSIHKRRRQENEEEGGEGEMELHVLLAGHKEGVKA